VYLKASFPIFPNDPTAAESVKIAVERWVEKANERIFFIKDFFFFKQKFL
jgi:hypothetical protein